MDVIKAEISKGCRTIDADSRDIDNCSIDQAGYFLIRLNKEKGKIELGFCRKENNIDLLIKGKSSKSIYNSFIENGVKLIPEHYAYLGKELAKAEIALKNNLKYVQDLELEINKS